MCVCVRATRVMRSVSVTLQRARCVAVRHGPLVRTKEPSGFLNVHSVLSDHQAIRADKEMELHFKQGQI